MSTSCFVGIRDPHHPHLVTVRYVAHRGQPSHLLPTLHDIWTHIAHRDTSRLVDLLLRNDWAVLAAAPHHRRPSRACVGTALGNPDRTRAGAAEEEPVTRFPLRLAAHLDVAWIYLIDPDTATVAVHTGDGGRHSIRPLPQTCRAGRRCCGRPERVRQLTIRHLGVR